MSPSGYGSGLLIRGSKEPREFESHHLRISGTVHSIWNFCYNAHMARFSELAQPYNSQIQEHYQSLISRMLEKGIQQVKYAEDLIIDNEGNLILDSGSDFQREFSKRGGLDWFLLFQTIIRLREVDQDAEDVTALTTPFIAITVPYVTSRLDELAA